MKSLLFSLIALLPISSFATDLTVTIVPPATYVDGRPIPSTDTLSCTLYGANQGQTLAKLATGPCTTFVRPGVTPGVTKCYSATATSSTSPTVESDQATPACVAIPDTPGVPSKPTVTLNVK